MAELTHQHSTLIASLRTTVRTLEEEILGEAMVLEAVVDGTGSLDVVRRVARRLRALTRPPGSE